MHGGRKTREANQRRGPFCSEFSGVVSFYVPAVWAGMLWPHPETAHSAGTLTAQDEQKRETGKEEGSSWSFLRVCVFLSLPPIPQQAPV